MTFCLSTACKWLFAWYILLPSRNHWERCGPAKHCCLSAYAGRDARSGNFSGVSGKVPCENHEKRLLCDVLIVSKKVLVSFEKIALMYSCWRSPKWMVWYTAWSSGPLVLSNRCRVTPQVCWPLPWKSLTLPTDSGEKNDVTIFSCSFVLVVTNMFMIDLNRREQNLRLVPLLLKRLRRLQASADFTQHRIEGSPNHSETTSSRPFAHLNNASPPYRNSEQGPLAKSNASFLAQTLFVIGLANFSERENGALSPLKRTASMMSPDRAEPGEPHTPSKEDSSAVRKLVKIFLHILTLFVCSCLSLTLIKNASGSNWTVKLKTQARRNVSSTKIANPKPSLTKSL